MHLDWAPHGNAIALALDDALFILDGERGLRQVLRERRRASPNQEAYYSALAWHPNGGGTLAVGAIDSHLRLWHVGDGIASVTDHTSLADGISALDWRPPLVVAGLVDGRVCLVDPRSPSVSASVSHTVCVRIRREHLSGNK